MERKWFRRYRSTLLSRKDLIALIIKTSIFTIHVVASIFESQSHMVHIEILVNGYFSFAHYFYIPTLCFPVISALLLFIKRNKISEISHNINMIGESLRIRMTYSDGKRPHCLFVLLLVVEFLYEYDTEGILMLVTPSVYTYYILMFLKWLVLWQFANRFAVLRFYYRQLSKLLNTSWVEKENLVKCHEMLGCCCTLLWECYALQMTIFFGYSFVLSVFYIYLVVDSYSRSGTLTPYHNVYLFWTILYCSFIWFIVYSCAETKNVAKKFDKKLSQQIMNDVTNKLINNKRIMQHFKVKFKDFSGMGFFNFDYPLLFSMVSSATTYIVILVQFSGR
ncbi:Gustatory receptor 147c, partial [Halyomorpha halys]